MICIGAAGHPARGACSIFGLALCALCVHRGCLVSRLRSISAPPGGDVIISDVPLT